MKAEEVSKGMFIKWYADRMFKGWNTYGKIIDVTDTNVTIVTFDDFKEVTISRTGEALENEISVATKETVMDYMELRRINLTAKLSNVESEMKRDIAEVELKAKKEARNLTENIDKMNTYLLELEHK